MKKYLFVSIINDTSNILVTTKEEAETLLHKNNLISFVANESKVYMTKGISFEDAEKELQEIKELL